MTAADYCPQEYIRPTMDLRFIIRDGERILQQCFRVSCIDGGNVRSEWRDVRTEENGEGK